MMDLYEIIEDAIDDDYIDECIEERAKEIVDTVLCEEDFSDFIDNEIATYDRQLRETINDIVKNKISQTIINLF